MPEPANSRGALESYPSAQVVARHARLVRDTMTNSALATPQISTFAARVIQKGLKPIHARATGNARRLRKR